MILFLLVTCSYTPILLKCAEKPTVIWFFTQNCFKSTVQEEVYFFDKIKQSKETALMCPMLSDRPTKLQTFWTDPPPSWIFFLSSMALAEKKPWSSSFLIYSPRKHTEAFRRAEKKQHFPRYAFRITPSRLSLGGIALSKRVIWGKDEGAKFTCALFHSQTSAATFVCFVVLLFCYLSIVIGRFICKLVMFLMLSTVTILSYILIGSHGRYLTYLTAMFF